MTVPQEKGALLTALLWRQVEGCGSPESTHACEKRPLHALALEVCV